MFFDYDSDVYFLVSRSQIDTMDIDSNGEDTCEMEIDDRKGNY